MKDRSLTGFMLNLVAALVAYSYQPRKPSRNFALYKARLVLGDDRLYRVVGYIKVRLDSIHYQIELLNYWFTSNSG